MNVQLPSNGIIGFGHLDLGEPTFNNTRKLLNISDCQDVIKTKFLSTVTKGDINEITRFDRDYLFIVAYGAIANNQITYKAIKCKKCNVEYKHTQNIADINIYDLPKESKLISNKTVNDITWNFKVLQVKDEIRAYQLCIDMLGYYEESIYLNILASISLTSKDFSFNYDSLESFQESILSLPTNVWLAAYSYMKTSFHGVPEVINSICPHCQGKNPISLRIRAEAVVFDPVTLMKYYKTVSQIISYTEFLDLTFAEYTALVGTFTS